MARGQDARKVLEIEAAAILGLLDRIGWSFNSAVEILSTCWGQVLVSGVGTSGIIARKIGATLTCMGMPSYFLHPVDALHGGLGLVKSEDVAILVSYSGETAELLEFHRHITARGLRTIAITGGLGSALARGSDVTLDCSVHKEACPLGLAPTASVVATIAIADALAVEAALERGITEDHFTRSHPGGQRGSVGVAR